MAFKRKRIYAPRRLSNKRGRFGRRRALRFRARGSLARTPGNAVTGFKNAASQGIAYKGRKTRPSTFRRAIFRNTQYKTHHRSNASATTTVTTPAGATTTVTSQLQALQSTGAFWTSAGGALAHDVGGAVPTFTGDIILRGGKIGLLIYNETANTSPIIVHLMLVRDITRDVATNIPANPPTGWDHTLVPEFTSDIGKYVMTRKQMTILPGDFATVEYRLKPMKIDQQDWSTDQSQITWLLSITDADNTATNTVRLTRYHNVSFSGDANT